MGNFDPKGFVASIDVPTAVVVTIADQLVPARKQRTLASAIVDSAVFDLAGDHRACWIEPRRFEAVTVAALEWTVGQVQSRSVAAGVSPPATA